MPPSSSRGRPHGQHPAQHDRVRRPSRLETASCAFEELTLEEPQLRLRQLDALLRRADQAQQRGDVVVAMVLLGARLPATTETLQPTSTTWQLLSYSAFLLASIVLDDEPMTHADQHMLAVLYDLQLGSSDGAGLNDFGDFQEGGHHSSRPSSTPRPRWRCCSCSTGRRSSRRRSTTVRSGASASAPPPSSTRPRAPCSRPPTAPSSPTGGRRLRGCRARRATTPTCSAAAAAAATRSTTCRRPPPSSRPCRSAAQLRTLSAEQHSRQWWGGRRRRRCRRRGRRRRRRRRRRRPRGRWRRTASTTSWPTCGSRPST